MHEAYLLRDTCAASSRPLGLTDKPHPVEVLEQSTVRTACCMEVHTDISSAIALLGLNDLFSIDFFTSFGLKRNWVPHQTVQCCSAFGTHCAVMRKLCTIVG